MPKSKVKAGDRSSLMYEFNYAKGRFKDVLFELEQRQVTGTALVRVLQGKPSDRRVIIFRDGAIVYAGRRVPSPNDFVRELAARTHVSALDAMLEFAAKRNSIQNVVRAMVDIRILTPSEISAAMESQAVSVLQELFGTTGNLQFYSSLFGFDFCRRDREKGGISIENLVSKDNFLCAHDQHEPAVFSIEKNKTRKLN